MNLLRAACICMGSAIALIRLRHTQRYTQLRSSVGSLIRPPKLNYLTDTNISVQCDILEISDPNAEVNNIIDDIDNHHGE